MRLLAPACTAYQTLKRPQLIPVSSSCLRRDSFGSPASESGQVNSQRKCWLGPSQLDLAHAEPSTCPAITIQTMTHSLKAGQQQALRVALPKGGPHLWVGSSGGPSAEWWYSMEWRE